ncbi:hypothetical protein ACFQH2_18010 [Natronoarchaeum sp. GCM10025703]|uniref:hypothetical protein n=1 Tax=Natronoarchaeum sp. GCM10025703 TaxID=3252685 RepID=UPI00360D4AD3
MDRNLPLAVLCGLVMGLGIYWFLSPDWFVAGGQRRCTLERGTFILPSIFLSLVVVSNLTIE